MKKIAFMLIALSFCITSNVWAQEGVAINTTGADPDNSAMLDIVSTTKGLLIPRMTQTQRNAISNPATGLMIYQTDNTPGYYFYNGSAWAITGSGVLGINDLTDGKAGGLSVFLGSGAGTNDDGSDNLNVAVGIEALNANTSGFWNTAVGYLSLNSNTGGGQNTSIGAYSLQANIGGGQNSAVGVSTLTFNATGWFNNAFGHQSLYWNTAGSSNNAFGSKSLNSNTTGHYNIGIGQEANRFNQEGSYNTVIGYQAGRGTSTHNKSYNVFLGCQAGYNETGSNRLYIENSNSATPLIYGEFDNDLVKVNGDFQVSEGSILSDGTSGTTPTSGAGTRFMWIPSKFALRAGSVNGTQWDDANIGSYSIAFGYNNTASGGYSLASGFNNSISGSSSAAFGYSNTVTRPYSYAFGNNSSATGSYSFAVGRYSEAQALHSIAMGRFNVVSGTWGTWVDSEPLFLIGNGADDANRSNAFTVFKDGRTTIGSHTRGEMLTVEGTVESTTGGFKFPDGTTQTTAAGAGVTEINDLTDGKTDTTSVFLGAGAGANDDGTANRNVALGIDALEVNTSGRSNSAYGYQALYKNTEGDGNTAVGIRALRYNTTGSNNTALGGYALWQNTSGEFNVGIGLGANAENQEGSRNTIIGYSAGSGASNHNKSGNVFIGYAAGYFETGDSKLYIENSTSSTPLIYGDFVNDLLKFNAEVELANGTSRSSLKFYERSIAGTNFTKFQSQDQAGDVTYTLPAADGSSGQVLQSNGSGILSWNNDEGATEIDELTDGKTDTTSVFLGSGAGANDVGTENHNVAFGINALGSNTTGYRNTACGYQVLKANTVSYDNTASGYRALKSNTGSNNTAYGSYALRWNTTGNSNVAIGDHALSNNTTGSQNTIIGHYAGLGPANSGISGNVFIGYSAGAGETGNNKLYIDNSGSLTPLIYGDFTNGSEIVKINGDFETTGDIETTGAFEITGNATIGHVLHLTPNSAYPSSPSEGDIFVHSVGHHIYCYLNGSWTQLD